MSDNLVLTDVAGGVATITLNRPEKMNAFTHIMMDELISAFDAADVATPPDAPPDALLDVLDSALDASPDVPDAITDAAPDVPVDAVATSSRDVSAGTPVTTSRGSTTRIASSSPT